MDDSCNSETTVSNSATLEGSDEEATGGASVYVDYRVFEIDVYGGPDDSLEDVNEIMDEQIETALDNIEVLKRMDLELTDEYDTGNDSYPGGMHQ